ncbi:MAG: hypothetical protein AAFV80_08260 [Bacteroidota bacterium]
METYEFHNRFTKYTGLIQSLASRHASSADEARALYLEVVYRAFKHRQHHNDEAAFMRWMDQILSGVLRTQATA